MTQIRRWFAPKHFVKQLEDAEYEVEKQQKALIRTERKEDHVNAIVDYLMSDKRKNHYGPTIAKALGRGP